MKLILFVLFLNTLLFAGKMHTNDKISSNFLLLNGGISEIDSVYAKQGKSENDLDSVGLWLYH